MQKKKLGCTSMAGILAALLTLLVITGAGIAQGGSQFSPGVLNNQPGIQTLGGVRTHAETGGRCAACHTQPWSRQSMSDRCLACHTELTTNPQDFHNVMLAQSRSSPCYGCHTDHRGPDGSLTVLNLAEFPHLSVGFSLAAHQRMRDGSDFACNDCHNAGFANFDPTVCQGCHTQIDPTYIQKHTQDYGIDCQACHDGVDRFARSFDHSQFPFKLAGKHGTVACAACHAGVRQLADFQSTEQDCAACHAKDDTHQGKFGADCAGCHTPDDWKNATFDHSKAAFQLTGAHTGVECTKCHLNNIFKGTPQQCVACHSDPPFHAGLFPTDCASCHTTLAWSPAQFNQAHTFPLDHGEGGISTCQTCHPSNLQTYTCYGCHEHNPDETAAEHLEEGISDFTDCVRCHATGREEN